MSKLIIALTAAGLLASASAYAADFAAADTNSDGVVSMDEATAAGISAEQFQGADKDGSGTLSAEEFASIGG